MSAISGFGLIAGSGRLSRQLFPEAGSFHAALLFGAPGDREPGYVQLSFKALFTFGNKLYPHYAKFSCW